MIAASLDVGHGHVSPQPQLYLPAPGRDDRRRRGDHDGGEQIRVTGDAAKRLGGLAESRLVCDQAAVIRLLREVDPGLLVGE